MAAFKLLSERANTVLVAIIDGANADGEMPARGWFPFNTVRMLEYRGYIAATVVDRTSPAKDLLAITDLGREYRTWSLTR